MNSERCACVNSDAKDCIRIRYRREPTDDIDDESDFDNDRCECPCHEEEDFDEFAI